MAILCILKFSSNLGVWSKYFLFILAMRFLSKTSTRFDFFVLVRCVPSTELP